MITGRPVVQLYMTEARIVEAPGSNLGHVTGDNSLILDRWYFETGDDGSHSKYLSGIHLRSFSSSL
jgi:hypothetical protein